MVCIPAITRLASGMARWTGQAIVIMKSRALGPLMHFKQDLATECLRLNVPHF
ncbi:hypothetical protein DPMN_186039 [Dreissena polymorpha]|uniref:Uncharacterized protein n=1 Tax=Dreissena polymorpha TaxID=45954 RepID=A0A9D4I7U3_DREPO|nr:hypothetical protein DPMN_186039 [Dreissena polymorpha]